MSVPLSNFWPLVVEVQVPNIPSLGTSWSLSPLFTPAAPLRAHPPWTTGSWKESDTLNRPSGTKDALFSCPARGHFIVAAQWYDGTLLHRKRDEASAFLLSSWKEHFRKACWKLKERKHKFHTFYLHSIFSTPAKGRWEKVQRITLVTEEPTLWALRDHAGLIILEITEV